MYGINAGTYLTPDQRKLAQQIQGKFDASLDSRDRALQQYGAPRLSSFVEDEALARAMSLARGLNYREPDTSTAGGVRTNTGLPTGGTRYTPPAAVAPTNQNTGAQNSAQWQRILSGLASIVPLLFGKDAYGQFLNKGLIQSVKETLFGKGAAASVSDAQLQQIIETNGAPYPTQAASDYWANQAIVEGGYPELTTDTSNWWTTPDTGSWWDTGNGWDFGSLGGA